MISKMFLQKSNYPKIILAILLLLAFIAMVWVVYTRLPVGVRWRPGVFSIGIDWKGINRPAALALLRGENPYDYALQNPVWVLFPLIPIALLSEELSSAVMFTTGFFIYGLITYKMGFKPWAIFLFLFNPITLSVFVTGNVDWMAALGFILPPQIGLFFLVLKPQLTIGFIAFLAFETWRKGGWREMLRVFGPVSAGILMTFIIWGLWPLHVAGDRMVDPYNASLFPTLLPVGAVLLFQAIRTSNPKLAIVSSVFLTPYLTLHGYAIALLGLDSAAAAVAVLGIWAMRYLELNPF